MMILNKKTVELWEFRERVTCLHTTYTQTVLSKFKNLLQPIQCADIKGAHSHYRVFDLTLTVLLREPS